MWRDIDARLTTGRHGFRLALAVLVLAPAWGCVREHRDITPTTLGTDLERMPRGKMVPFPWPGQDISELTPRSGHPMVDPEAALASDERRQVR